MADIAKIVEEIKGLTVLELNDLVKAVEEEFGVSAAAPVAVAAAGAAPAAPAAEEKSEFNVCLKAFDATKRMALIKTIKEVTGLGLGESKALLDSAPSVIKEAAPKDEAEEIMKKLVEAGAEIELK